MHFRTRNSYILLLVILLALVLAGSTVTASDTSEKTFAFRETVISVLPGTTIGDYYGGILMTTQYPVRWGKRYFPYERIYVSPEEFDAATREIIGNSKYRWYFFDFPWEDVSYLIMADIVSIHLDIYPPITGNYSFAEVSVKWQVYEPASNSMVHTDITYGQASETGKANATILSAFRQALDAFLINRELASILIGPPNTVAEQPVEEIKAIKLKASTSVKELMLPQNLEQVYAAAVTVRAGSFISCGALISPDGYVLTAGHTVFDTNEAFVTLRSGIVLPAEVICVDSIYDIALLKIPGVGYSALSFGEQSPTGADVYAIGAPTGEKESFSSSKSVMNGPCEMNGLSYIQILGNLGLEYSGGPLVNANGELIGIIESKQWAEGFSFAVPTDVISTRLGIQWY
jgi:S1-C subfamily serine protease